VAELKEALKAKEAERRAKMSGLFKKSLYGDKEEERGMKNDKGARRQTAAQLEALVGGLAARLGGLEEGQRRIASGVELLVSKKQDVHTKEAALEQNRIDPADVERTGEVIGRGAYGIAGSL
jgi:hypothetical protein